MKALLDIMLRAQYQDGGVCRQTGVRRDHGHGESPVLLDGHDADMVPLSHIQLADGLIHPARRDLDFKDGVVVPRAM